ncbi:nicotinate-nucleotide--dimethylbenzimidazole phosphoribosyltransferase [Sulfobacillus acidophilus TPY]|uniref:Nicotinate-nucleotide--dimethylbenzimidazole phosphoribosyltransferase n=1 Tax=Sulfobacillus acidophilus (strain ATCC 700253 / DSM 10332 / NAL) TaxID=679936 RepID=G8TU78_SULAD|nr:nicotinate-nucleotide--dimethylbenzimidazole phosphoribosyltransferase [Sulfobacillus acidophilus TPY]AEW05750.1 Nicotinate-nucleotide--dimethylbenzimidazole phosphoribosyltransferase [Sulfobacillus acidophilus DSM 10332]
MDEPRERETIEERAQARLDQLTKPLGSLGRLEPVIVRLAKITGRVIPRTEQPMLLVFAADHGVAEEGVSRYAPEVTEEMAVNLAMGTAVSSVLARNQGIPIEVVDVGIARAVRHPAVLNAKVAWGTQNFVEQSAMTPEQARQAVDIGQERVRRAVGAGHDILLLGELGIGNTTAASALAAVLLGVDPAEVLGRGTGLDDRALAHKERVIRQALARHPEAMQDPWDAMARLGGFEIAALAGAVLEAARHRMPVVLDGFITGVAALWATRVDPAARDVLLASHRSAEPGHRRVLDELGLTPLLDLELRLGEGSGALFAYPLIRLAGRVMAETATFEDARVTPVGHPPAETPKRLTAESPPVARDFSDSERAAVYRVIEARRDVRVFLPDPLPHDVLQRILRAGHLAPSVGFMQPWNFIVVTDRTTLDRIYTVVDRERVRAAENYSGIRQAHYLRLKVEGLKQAPATLCVTLDRQRGGPHVLGRNTILETDLMSVACAIENIWLAARAEGVAAGWVSMYRKEDIRDILGIPEPVDPVALLSLGYTPHFADEPGLQRAGWARRLPLAEVIYRECWGRPGDFYD